MFNGKRRFIDTRTWVKVDGESLDSQFSSLSSDYDICILRHWFYCMASAPMTTSFSSKETIEGYLKNSVNAGDRIEVWGIMLDSVTPVVSAKMPDEDGLVPLKGAY